MRKEFAPNVFTHVATEMVWLELMDLPGEPLRFFREFPDGYFFLYNQKTGLRRAVYFRVGSRNRSMLVLEGNTDRKLVMKLLMEQLAKSLESREGWPETYADLQPHSENGLEQIEKEVADVIWPSEGKERRTGETSIRSSNARGEDHPGRYVSTINLRLPRGLRFTTSILEPKYSQDATRGAVNLWDYKLYFTLTHPTIKPQLLMTNEVIAEELEKAMVESFSFMAAPGTVKNWDFEAFAVVRRT